MTATSGVLSNDSVNTTDPTRVSVVFPEATTQGGALTATANSGAFTYTPPAGFAGTDTFTYTLSNGFATATATVTITVQSGQVATRAFSWTRWRAMMPRDRSPFRTFQAAVAAAAANRDVVVRSGSYTGSVTLLNAQRPLPDHARVEAYKNELEC